MGRWLGLLAVRRLLPLELLAVRRLLPLELLALAWRLERLTLARRLERLAGIWRLEGHAVDRAKPDPDRRTPLAVMPAPD